MKTALTELIEIWESEYGSYIPNAPIYKAFIDEAKSFLEKEKEQIYEAFVAGSERGCGDVPFNCEQYYSQTFK